jgi:dolichol-phosphate mannosyltransferase
LNKNIFYLFDTSVVIPAKNEHKNILQVLKNISKLKLNIELIIVVDSIDDTTIAAVEEAKSKPRYTKILVQDCSPGPAHAIRIGIKEAKAECVVVMMADGSDDVFLIPTLVSLVSSGFTVASASRHMKGGKQIGGSRLKRLLSKTVGLVLVNAFDIGTSDPTNSFKAYSKKFVEYVGIESTSGFEIGIELTSKAYKNRFPITEVPTIWIDRTEGVSNFKLLKWIPSYLKWFFNFFGRRASKVKYE